MVPRHLTRPCPASGIRPSPNRLRRFGHGEIVMRHWQSRTPKSTQKDPLRRAKNWRQYSLKYRITVLGLSVSERFTLKMDIETESIGE